jgi:hypothetical protein
MTLSVSSTSGGVTCHTTSWNNSPRSTGSVCDAGAYQPDVLREIGLATPEIESLSTFQSAAGYQVGAPSASVQCLRTH